MLYICRAFLVINDRSVSFQADFAEQLKYEGSSGLSVLWCGLCVPIAWK
jgi:hypothetical protein